MKIGDYCFVSNQSTLGIAGVVSFITEKAVQLETEQNNLWIPFSQVLDWDFDRISLLRDEWYLWIPDWLLKGETDAVE